MIGSSWKVALLVIVTCHLMNVGEGRSVKKRGHRRPPSHFHPRPGPGPRRQHAKETVQQLVPPAELLHAEETVQQLVPPAEVQHESEAVLQAEWPSMEPVAVVENQEEFVVATDIIGGTPVVNDDFKWQVSLQMVLLDQSFHICGASLLSETTVLCAAHCVRDVDASGLQVVAGLTTLGTKEGTQVSKVSGYIMHEQFCADPNAVSIANDISLINLATPIKPSSTVQFLTLPPVDYNYNNVNCTMTGWGKTSGTSGVSMTLQKASISVISTTDCAKSLRPVSANVWANQICLHDPANKVGACNGDSGGSLNCPVPGGDGWYMAGITSFGITSTDNGVSSCLPTFPSVYTSTNAYRDWITEHVDQSNGN